MSQATLVFSLEAVALAHHNHMHHLLGQHMDSYDIYLSMPEPVHIQRYQMLHPVRFHFDASALPGVRVVMPATMLEVALALGDEEVMREIDARCSVLGQMPKRGDVDWTEYVTMVLRETRGVRVTIEDIAQRMQVSARTIGRQLKKDGQDFHARIQACHGGYPGSVPRRQGAQTPIIGACSAAVFCTPLLAWPWRALAACLSMPRRTSRVASMA